MTVRKIQLIEASKDDQGNLRSELYGLSARDRYQDVETTTASLTSGYRLEVVYDSTKFADVPQVKQACNALADIVVERYGTRPKTREWSFGSAGADSVRLRAGSVTSGLAFEALINDAQFASATAVRDALRAIS